MPPTRAEVVERLAMISASGLTSFATASPNVTRPPSPRPPPPAGPLPSPGTCRHHEVRGRDQRRLGRRLAARASASRAARLTSSPPARPRPPPRAAATSSARRAASSRAPRRASTRARPPSASASSYRESVTVGDDGDTGGDSASCAASSCLELGDDRRRRRRRRADLAAALHPTVAETADAVGMVLALAHGHAAAHLAPAGLFLLRSRDCAGRCLGLATRCPFSPGSSPGCRRVVPAELLPAVVAGVNEHRFMVVLHSARHAASLGRSTARRERDSGSEVVAETGLRLTRRCEEHREPRNKPTARRFPMHESCGICLQDINEGEPTTYLHMHSAHGFHAFHKDCATP